MTLAGLGYKFNAGTGITAAQKIFIKYDYLDK
jgi:hypothetical protein